MSFSKICNKYRYYKLISKIYSLLKITVILKEENKLKLIK